MCENLGRFCGHAHLDAAAHVACLDRVTPQAWAGLPVRTAGSTHLLQTWEAPALLPRRPPTPQQPCMAHADPRTPGLASSCHVSGEAPKHMPAPRCKRGSPARRLICFLCRVTYSRSHGLPADQSGIGLDALAPPVEGPTAPFAGLSPGLLLPARPGLWLILGVLGGLKIVIICPSLQQRAPPLSGLVGLL